MCTLYGLRATHPTRAACALRVSQNARIDQSSRPLGWGAAIVAGSHVTYRRQIDPAAKREAVRARTMSTEGTLLLSQLSRLKRETDDTRFPPFCDDTSLLAVDGSIPAFDQIRTDLLGALPPERADFLQGASMGEHLHQLLLERHRQVPDRPLVGTIRATLLNVSRWSASVAPGASLSLRLLWAFPPILAGASLNRPLWIVQRDAPVACSHCGRPHAYPPSSAAYGAVAVASSRLTDEDWEPLPDASLFAIGDDGSLSIQPLTARQSAWLYSTG